jgi:small GTP-binding protein
MAPDDRKADEVPTGLKHRHTLQGHKGVILHITWSPDGRMLASSSVDHSIRIWDPLTGMLLHTLEGHYHGVNHAAWSPTRPLFASSSFDRTIRIWSSETWEHLRTLSEHTDDVPGIAWSPDGAVLASCSMDKTILLWNADNWEIISRLLGHSGGVSRVAWSPDGRKLASCSHDCTIRIWSLESGEHSSRILKGHTAQVISVAWSPDGRVLASSSFDRTVRIWDPDTGRLIRILEGHWAEVRSVSFSSDNQILASSSGDGTVKLWRCDTWEMINKLDEEPANFWPPSVTFSPKEPVLATLGEWDTVIRLWDLDPDALLGMPTVEKCIYFTNAKVVMVGDSGVGKSGLGLVLTDQSFVPTESTHGRHVWEFDSREVDLEDGSKEMCETLLWDLAGQPGYRLIHQLYLNEVAVALVVFDARSETDPFTGVRHWDRALRQAQRLEGDAALPMKKFLVAARADRGAIPVSQTRIDSLMADLNFDGYFETSAREGWNITKLSDTIREAIDWDLLPKVMSTDLFQSIKSFLIKEKEARRLLSTVDELHRAYLNRMDGATVTEELRAQFETCIGRIESRGLIRRLSFGDLVLLKPELLDAYATAIVNAARQEPDGLGNIAEEDALAGRFRLPQDERIQDKGQEKLLLISTVEELLRHEVALREYSDDGSYIVFPSQLTRENPEMPDPEGKAVIFDFEGPVLSIYATLAVRLSHSGVFKKKEMWKNAATYSTRVGGTCGMFLREAEEAHGELTLFFDAQASEEVRLQFEEYVQIHLLRRALPESISRRRVFVCSKCSTPVMDLQVERRRSRGFSWIQCNVCEERVSLLDKVERLTVVHASAITEMDHTADAMLENELGKTILGGTVETGVFDVFLAHNGEDKPAVKEIAEQLRERGIRPWLDEWEISPFVRWQDKLQEIIPQIKSAAIFIGPSGMGPWQDIEINGFLEEFARRRIRMGPVLLPGCHEEPEVPLFLRSFNWVDFRKDEPDPLEQLIWGITGKRSISAVSR